MRRNATKVAAAVLSLAVTMTSINLPTTAAAAKKKVKLNKTKATLKVGKTTTLKVTKGGKKVNATFTSNKTKIATVGKKTGKVTAKKKGTATITAKYAGKKYTCKITVKKANTTPVATDAPAPTDAPAATDAPAPTDAPAATDAPAPTATASVAAGTIATASAIKANQIEVSFGSALPDNMTVQLTRKGGSVPSDVKQDKDASGTKVTFTSATKFPTGTYTVTVTSNGTTVSSKDVEITAQAIKEITITSEKALTDDSRKKVYLYYDVLDQYGESMRTSASISWSSSTGKITADKSIGRLTLEKATGVEDPEFKYGDKIYVLGVDAKTGIKGEKNLTVDMQRAVDAVEFKGFVSKYEDKIIDSLPADFAKDRYFLLYDALDQDGKPMEAKDYTTAGESKLTFVGNNYTLISSDLRGNGKTRVVNGREYCAVAINPGMYVDRGGEITISAISNITGRKTEHPFNIGKAPILSTLSLSTPNNVADGDQDVPISFTATDTEGRPVTSYETIVRSTNKLKLTASAGKLMVKENASGQAEITWSDDADHSAYNFNTSSSHDAVDRNVSLTTVIVGGTPSTETLYVSDTRRPVAVSKVKLNDDDNDMITRDNTATIKLFDGDVEFIDQYGEKLETEKAKAFFLTTASGKGFDGHQYGVGVDYSAATSYVKVKVNNPDNNANAMLETYSTSASKNNATGHSIFFAYKNSVPSEGFNSKPNSTYDSTKMVIETEKEDTNNDKGLNNQVVWNTNIRYSVSRVEKTGTTVSGSGVMNGDSNKVTGTDTTSANTSSTSWSSVDAEKNISYTIVPVSKLSKFAIDDIKKVRIVTDYSTHLNGQDLDNKQNSVDTIAELNNGLPDIETKREVKVKGSYNGKTITIPTKYCNFEENNTSGTFIVTNGKIESLNTTTGSAIAIKYGDLYDFTKAKNDRRDVRRAVSVIVYRDAAQTSDIETVKANVMVSDERRTPVKIEFVQNKAKVNKLTLQALLTKLNFTEIEKIEKIEKVEDADGKVGVLITDQYDDVIVESDKTVDGQNIVLEFKVSDYKENTNEYAHLPNSCDISKNNSNGVEINGVEIMDTFNLTATIGGTNLSASVPVTMEADKKANIYYDRLGNPTEFDEGYGTTDIDGNTLSLRDILGYDR